MSASELSDRERAIARNEIAAAVERVQGFTRLDIRYGIAGQVIDALTSVGWAVKPKPTHRPSLGDGGGFLNDDV